MLSSGKLHLLYFFCGMMILGMSAETTAKIIEGRGINCFIVTG